MVFLCVAGVACDKDKKNTVAKYSVGQDIAFEETTWKVDRAEIYEVLNATNDINPDAVADQGMFFIKVFATVTAKEGGSVSVYGNYKPRLQKKGDSKTIFAEMADASWYTSKGSAYLDSMSTSSPHRLELVFGPLATKDVELVIDFAPLAEVEASAIAALDMKESADKLSTLAAMRELVKLCDGKHPPQVLAWVAAHGAHDKIAIAGDTQFTQFLSAKKRGGNEEYRFLAKRGISTETHTIVWTGGKVASAELTTR